MADARVTGNAGGRAEHCGWDPRLTGNRQPGLAPQPMEISHNIQQDEAKSGVWTLGSEMRSIRISRGLALEDVAERLKIKASVLSALEEGQEDNLPGRIYTLGFIRAYAEFLGLDGAEAVARYKREHDISVQPVELNFPVPPPSSGLPKKWIMLVAIGAAVAIFAGWQAYDRSRRSEVETVAVPPLTGEEASPATVADKAGDDAGTTAVERALPTTESAGSTGGDQPAVTVPAAERPRGMIPAEEEAAAMAAASSKTTSPETEAAGKPAPVVSANSAAADPAEEPASAASSASATQQENLRDSDSAVVSSAMAAQSAPADGGQDGGALSGQEVVAGKETAPAVPPRSVSGKEETVAVPPPSLPERTSVNLAMADPKAKDRVAGDEGGRIVIRARQESWVQVTSADRTLLTRVLRPGDEFRVPDMDGLRLDTGNAGGLEIWVDGKRIPPLAPVGNALSGVDLSPEKLLARR